MNKYMAEVGLAVVVSLAGCVADTGGEDRSQVGVAEAAVVNGWTPFTSEEFPPIACDGANAFTAASCRGDNCDDISALCQPIANAWRGDSSWTSRFSEEGTNNRVCPDGAWVVGLACFGDNCDDVSLQCAQMGGVTPTDCGWTGWFSEERGGTLYFLSGYFARGAACDGDNCDNMSFYVCEPR